MFSWRVFPENCSHGGGHHYRPRIIKAERSEKINKIKNTPIPFLHSPSFKETDFQGIYYKSTRFFFSETVRVVTTKPLRAHTTHYPETSLEISVYG
jgi:hypothetical protein